MKKSLSLILAGILLLQTANCCTFAYNNEEFDATGGSDIVDYCKDFPKNQYGETVNINCAFTQLMIDQKINRGQTPGLAEHIGSNGDYEIRVWNTDQIKGFGKELEHLIEDRSKNALKHSFIGNLINTTKNFLSLNSIDLAVGVTKKLVTNSKFFKNMEITAKDINMWKNYYKKNVPDFIPNKTIRDVCGFFHPIRYFCKKDFFEKQDLEKKAYYSFLRQEEARKSHEEGIRAEVYSSLFDQVVYAILNRGYVGKDSLVANLNFN